MKGFGVRMDGRTRRLDSAGVAEADKPPPTAPGVMSSVTRGRLCDQLPHPQISACVDVHVSVCFRVGEQDPPAVTRGVCVYTLTRSRERMGMQSACRCAQARPSIQSE